MKIVSSLIDSAYSRRIGNETSESRKKTDNGKNTPKTIGDEVDTVDLSTGLSLEKIQGVLQTAIGKKIDEMMAEAGVDFTSAVGLDWSPEATSDRIFSMSTGLFGVWRDQHPEMSEEELIDSFENVIRSSVDKGAGEAVALIRAAGFGDDTKSVTDETMSLLHEKLDVYFDNLRGAQETETSQGKKE